MLHISDEAAAHFANHEQQQLPNKNGAVFHNLVFHSYQLCHQYFPLHLEIDVFNMSSPVGISFQINLGTF